MFWVKQIPRSLLGRGVAFSVILYLQGICRKLSSLIRFMPGSSTPVSSTTISSTPVLPTVISSTQRFYFYLQ